MEPGIKEKVRAPRRQSLKKQPKIDKEKADQEMFKKVLDTCKRILFAAMDSGQDIFELLDPLMSDTQCHLHTILILNTIHKCYDKFGSTYHGIEKLDEKDTEILSHAVLFSLLKMVHKDEADLRLHEISIRHFNGLILPSKKREIFCFIEARKKLNAYSVDFLKSVAINNVREILYDCQTSSLITPLKFLPCFATYIAVFDYIERKRLPIIVSMITINKQPVDGSINFKYHIRSKDVRYYEFRENGNRLCHKKDLLEFEKKIPTVAFNCYSLISHDAHELAMDYDIRDLLMLCAASHIQLPNNAKLPADYDEAEKYVRSLYAKYPDVYDEYIKYHELGQKLDLIDVKYSTLTGSSLKQEDGNPTFTIERSRRDITFDVEHVYLSNYTYEYQRVKSLDVNAEFDQTETFNLFIEKVTLDEIVQVNEM